MYSSLVVLLHIGVIGIPLILSSRQEAISESFVLAVWKSPLDNCRWSTHILAIVVMTFVNGFKTIFIKINECIEGQ